MLMSGGSIMRRFPYLAPLLILVALPAIGIVCTLIIDTIYDLEQIRAACSIPEIQQEHASACSDIEQIYLLRDASSLALLASLFILLVWSVRFQPTSCAALSVRWSRMRLRQRRISAFHHPSPRGMVHPF